MIELIRKNFPSAGLMLIILVLGGIYLFKPSMSEYPSYVHAWTQSDRLALAMNFQENGFDLFHPATFNLLTKDGITQVDFPIHDYIVALIAKITHFDLLHVFRTYDLAFFLLGLFFLFLASLKFGLSGIRSIYSVVFVFTLPFLVYYGNGFLPSIPSLGFFFIALFHLASFLENDKKQSLIWASLFFTLAALSRSPFLIYLIALFGLVLFQNKSNIKKILPLLLPIFLGIGIFGLYYIYNQALSKEYGSMFLDSFMSIDSFGEGISILSSAIDRWQSQILSPFHAVGLILLLIAGIYQFSSMKISGTNKALLTYLLIVFLGVFAFFILMGKQFVDHDYYYIDILVPILTVLLLFLFKNIQVDRPYYAASGSLGLLFFFYFFSSAKESQAERYTPTYNDRVHYAYEVYKAAIPDMKNWGIDLEDTLLVLDANSTNIPFTLWKTRGYTALNSTRDTVIKFLAKPHNYVALVDSFFFMDTYKEYPEIIQRLKRVQSNGTLSLYELKDHNNPSEYFGEKVRYYPINFDEHKISDHHKSWGRTAEIFPNYGTSLIIEPNQEFDLAFEDSLSNLNTGKNVEIILQAEFFQKDTSFMQVVCQFGEYYFTYFTENSLEKTQEWEFHQYRFTIPKRYIQEDVVCKVYFWNPKQGTVFIDNYSLLLFQ